jgi:two-component system, OmpR family, response regulator VicR
MTKVLVVSDSTWVINDVFASLGSPEWDIETVDDPKTAAAVAYETGADIVIADLQIHAMGGMAVIRDISADFEGEKRPRLVMLLDREADAFLARRAGADAFVVKPFQAPELREAMRAG